MFKLTHPLPDKFYVACSGGVDSISALHWLARANKDRLLGAINIHHNTGRFADESKSVVEKFCSKHDIPLLCYSIVGTPPKNRSKEDWWREQRYKIFNEVPNSHYIILAHNLDDCLEEYLMCMLVRGYESTIQYSHGRCIRPFRKWAKKDIINYAKRNGLDWAEDPSNRDTHYKRNFIRHNIVPQALELNPGLYNLVERLIDMIDDNNKPLKRLDQSLSYEVIMNGLGIVSPRVPDTGKVKINEYGNLIPREQDN